MTVQWKSFIASYHKSTYIYITSQWSNISQQRQKGRSVCLWAPQEYIYKYKILECISWLNRAASANNKEACFSLKGRQDDSTDIHWRRWRQLLSPPVWTSALIRWLVPNWTGPSWTVSKRVTNNIIKSELIATTPLMEFRDQIHPLMFQYIC